MKSAIQTLLGDMLSVLSARLPASSSSSSSNENNDLPKYNYPSAGHLYPLQTLIFVPQDHYLGYYHPLNNCLVRIPSDPRLPDILNEYRYRYKYNPPHTNPTSTPPSSTLPNPLASSTGIMNDDTVVVTTANGKTGIMKDETGITKDDETGTTKDDEMGTTKDDTVVHVYLLFVAEREAIEPVYGASLSLEFMYLEVGYMEELLRMHLLDIDFTHSLPLPLSLSQDCADREPTLHSLPVSPTDRTLRTHLKLTDSQIPIHILLLSQ